MVGIAALVVIQPYLTTILLAMLTVLVFRKPYAMIHTWVGYRDGLASLLSILLVFVTLVVPMVILLTIVLGQSLTFVRDAQSFIINEEDSIREGIISINRSLQSLPADFRIDQTQVLSRVQDAVRPVGTFILQNLARIGGSTLSFITALVVYIMLLGSIFPNQQRLKEFFLRISPFDRETNLLYLRRIVAMSESMIIGTVVVAVIQGFFAALTLALVGMPYVFFWFMTYVFLSIVPLGGGLIMIPIGLFLILTGHVWQGVLVIASQVVLLSNIDNVLRPRIVSKEAAMEPSIILIGVLGGVSVFGFFGVIYGPVILIFLQTTIELYMKYYHFSVRKKLRER